MMCATGTFQLTHLLRGATTRSKKTLCCRWQFQLTHLLRGATISTRRMTLSVAISTHAPLARCDELIGHVQPLHQIISTHAPLARCDGALDYRALGTQFQLTHLLRGATIFGAGVIQRKHFNSRTSCEVRRCSIWPRQPFLHFNSRTSCEVRRGTGWVSGKYGRFQLTHLLRGATLW